MKRKMSAIKKKQYQRGLKPWNYGIPTKSNDALDKYREEHGGMFGSNHPHWRGGLNPMWIRKQRLMNNGGSHTKWEWNALRENYKNRCAECNKEGLMTKDHIIPISKNGTDDIENLQPLCRSCNSKKHVNV